MGSLRKRQALRGAGGAVEVEGDQAGQYLGAGGVGLLEQPWQGAFHRHVRDGAGGGGDLLVAGQDSAHQLAQLLLRHAQRLAQLPNFVFHRSSFRIVRLT